MKLSLIAASLISALALAEAASIKCEKKYERKYHHYLCVIFFAKQRI
jgi:hypothetical protein